MARGAIALALGLGLAALTAAWLTAGRRPATDPDDDIPAPPPASAPPAPGPTGPPPALPPIWQVEAGGATLMPGPRLVAQATGEAGEPVRTAGIRLQIDRFTRQDDPEPRETLGEAVTDAEGRADLTVLAPDLAAWMPDDPRAALRVVPRGTGLYAPAGPTDHTVTWLGLPTLLDTLRSAGVRDAVVVPIRVQATRAITFRVVDHEGRALPGMRVRGEPASRFLETAGTADRRGLATLRYRGAVGPSAGHADRLVPDRRDLSGRLLVAAALAHQPDPAGVDRLVDAARRLGLGPSGLARVRQACEIEGLADEVPHLVIEDTREIELECVDGQGLPIADADLLGLADSAALDTATQFRTDGSGVAALLVPRGCQRVTVRHTMPGFLEGHAPLPESPTPIRTVLHRLVTVDVTLRFTGEGKRPPYRDLRFAIELGDREVPLGATARAGEARDGALRLQIPATPGLLRAATADGDWTGATEVKGVADEQLILELGGLRDAHTVRFWIRDGDGKAAADAPVTLLAVGEDQARPIRTTARTDRNGILAARLPAGVYPMVILMWAGADRAARVAETKSLRVERDMLVPVQPEGAPARSGR